MHKRHGRRSLAKSEGIRLSYETMSREKHIVSGAEMISRAAADAGVNFFAGYPITPANGVFVGLLDKLQASGGVGLGVSDEISAIAFCLGASLRGAKAMTATSGPGFALMIENLSYAVMAEIPFVLVLGQRLGPSTGGATANAEGDILLVSSCTSGAYPIPVLAPNSIQSCYEVTFRAVNIAERYRTPVIVLTEKDILMSFTDVDTESLPRLKKVERSHYHGETYRSYDYDNLSLPPDFVNVGSSDHRVVITGSLHDKDGRLCKERPESLEVLRHLREKIEGNVEDISFYEKDFDSDAVICLISFLATDLSAREAVRDARKKGIPVRHLTLFSLFPLPIHVIKEAVDGLDTVIIPEENHDGQYAGLLAGQLPGKIIKKVNHVGGLLPPEMIFKALQEAKTN